MAVDLVGENGEATMAATAILCFCWCLTHVAGGFGVESLGWGVFGLGLHKNNHGVYTCGMP